MPVCAAEQRFCVAGVEVSLTSPQPDGLANLAGFYNQYPSCGRTPHLELAVEQVPGFTHGRQRGPEYPGFRTTRRAPNTIALARFDAHGEITIPAAVNDTVRGWFRVHTSANSLEAAIRIAVSVTLPRLGGLILHASAVAARGRAHVFAGRSGAGKSTIANLLAAQSPAKLADELLIVKATAAGTWAAHVTPFIGGQGLPHRTHWPVDAIHFLVQAPHHRRTTVPGSAALGEILRHVLVYVAEPGTAGRVLDTAAQLVAAVPCFRLEFAKRADVIDVLAVT